jgi:hypothetical protein
MDAAGQLAGVSLISGRFDQFYQRRLFSATRNEADGTANVRREARRKQNGRNNHRGFAGEISRIVATPDRETVFIDADALAEKLGSTKRKMKDKIRHHARPVAWIAVAPAASSQELLGINKFDYFPLSSLPLLQTND